MKQSRCPHCNDETGLGLWEKTGLGPGRSRHCKTCGGAVGVSLLWIVVFTLLTGWFPLLLAFLGLIVSDALSSSQVLSGAMASGGLAVGAFVLALLYKRVVPLSARAA